MKKNILFTFFRLIQHRFVNPSPQSTHPVVLPTKWPELNCATTLGGLPCHRIIEILGQASSGKTTLALHIVAGAQKQNQLCVWFDLDRSFQPSRAKNCGVQTENLLIIQPESVDQAIALIDKIVKMKSFSWIVLDAWDALLTSPQSYRYLESLSTFCQTLHCGVILTSQSYSKNKNFFYFYADIRLQIDYKQTPVLGKINLSLVYNRWGPSHTGICLEGLEETV